MKQREISEKKQLYDGNLPIAVMTLDHNAAQLCKLASAMSHRDLEPISRGAFDKIHACAVGLN
jgi:hypothetical protein